MMKEAYRAHLDTCAQCRATPPVLCNDGATLSLLAEAEYPAFESIARLSRPCVITEKLDGTNGLVSITEDGVVRAGSRKQWLTLQDHNYGFARWVAEHASELREGLGPGDHHGEWWGQGVPGRKYGTGRKVFSLFNTRRWLGRLDPYPVVDPLTDKRVPPPACCEVVPVLYRGLFTMEAVENALSRLAKYGSAAAPGFMKPEGVVIYHQAAQMFFKKTLEHDESGKGS
jgi:hypothetical protein